MQLSWEAPAILRWLLPLIVLAAGLRIRRLYLQTEPGVSPGQRRRLLALRWCVLLLLAVGTAQPRLVLRRSVAVSPAVVVVVDDTASMARADGPGGRTRWQQALAVVARVDSVVRSAGGGARLIALRGNGLAAPDSLRPRVPPAARGGDPAALARRALLAAGAAVDPLVIAVTDGHSTVTNATPVPWTGSVPPVLVGVGDATATRPVRLVDLRYPRQVHAGDRAAVEVAFALAPPGGPSLQVALMADDTTAASAAVHVGPGGLARASLAVPVARPGLHLLRLVVTGAAGDTVLAPVELAIRATRRWRRLLVVAPRPGWIVRSLLQACALTGDVRGEAAWPTPDGWRRGDSLLAWEPPTRPDGWRRWQAVVLLGDGRDLPADAVRALTEATREGLGLAVVAEAGRPRHDPVTSLRLLLPVTGIGTPRRGEWRLVAEPVGMLPPSLTTAFWRQGVRTDDLPPWLPPLDWLVPARPRDGALVLLGGRPAGGGTAAPVVVRDAAAGGRRLWIAGSGLWLDAFWRPPLQREAGEVAPSPFRRWLAALLADLAGGGGTDAPVVLQGMRDLYRAGETIPLRAEVRGTAAPDDTSWTAGTTAVLVESVPAGPDSLAHTLVRLRGAGTVWRGELAPPPPGILRLRPLLVTAHGDTLRGRPVRLAVTAGSPEDDQAGQAAVHLRDLAAGWGGLYLDAAAPGSARRLASRLQEHLAGKRTVVRVRTIDPVRRPWYLGILVLLLAAEWWLRRRHGMQ